MSKYVEKSEAAKSICFPLWEKSDDPCGRCPLYSKCCTVTPPGREAFNNWMAGINELAEKVAAEKEVESFKLPKPYDNKSDDWEAIEERKRDSSEQNYLAQEIYY